MAERPILFSAPMVRALLDGRKTQTRRIVKCDEHLPEGPYWHVGGFRATPGAANKLPPPYVPGRHLWVRETWYCDDFRALRKEDLAKAAADPALRADFLRVMDYRADHDCNAYEAGCPCRDDQGRGSWRPSIFMPRWASRITLEIVDVRVQRLQDISEDDALAEGVEACPYVRGGGGEMPGGCECHLLDAPRPYACSYAQLWEEINGAGAWDANPWVWCVSFRRVDDG